MGLHALLFAGAISAAAQSLEITAPVDIAGKYPARPAFAFGPVLTEVSGEIVLVNDGDNTSDLNSDGTAGTFEDGCQAITNDVSGKIALIDRGDCGFPQKAQNAQNAGAIAVVICNNDVSYPNALTYMGGTDPGTLTIPTMMVSFSTCIILKSALANGAVSGNTVLAAAGENCELALTAVEGVNNAPAPSGGTALSNFASSGLYYKFTPATNAFMHVSSCIDTVDTNLLLLGGDCDALFVLASNDDQDFLGDIYCSDTLTQVYAGTEYTIYWENTWATLPFQWELNLEALPSSSVTFHVDMQNETVEASGVKISINGGPEADMTDDGNGIWSYTTTATVGDLLTYMFSNGTDNFEGNPDLANCRTVEVDFDPTDLPVVCYNSCTVCPPVAVCPLWVDENFDNYMLGGLSAQSPIWVPWTPNNTEEDALVSDVQSASGSNSLLVSNASDDDQVLLLGNLTAGNYILKWRVYVPTGSSAFYNILKNTNLLPNVTIGDVALNVFFNADGTGSIDAGGAAAATFTYPMGEWVDVYHQIDLDNNWIRLWIDGKTVFEWPFNWAVDGPTGINQLGGVDFFGNDGNLYYIDDVKLKQVDACPADAIICDAFDGYDIGGLDNQSPWWGTWDPGDVDQDGLVSNEQFLSCEQALKISEANGDDQLLLLGEKTTGNYSLSWDLYVPNGSAAYYNIQKKVTAATANADFAYAVYFAADGVATADVGAAGAFTFDFPHGEWFHIEHTYDLDNNTASLFVNGVQIETWAANLTATQGAGVKKIGSVDFFGDADNLYYVDNVLFQQLPSVPGDICGGAIDLNQYFGQGINSVTSTPLFDNTDYSTDASDPTTGYDCWGEPDGGGDAPSLENTMWYTFVGDGETYLIETANCGATDYIDDGDTQMAIYAGTCDNLTAVACNEDGPSATTTLFPAGYELVTTPGTVYFMMIDGFNFNGAISDGEYCIKITQQTGAAVDSVEVTFQVDMTWVLDAGGSIQGIKIAGNFADNGATIPNWSTDDSPAFTHIGNDVYETTIKFPETSVGNNVEYKFLNTADTWGDCHVEQECMGAEDADCKSPTSDNRLLVIPAADETNCYNWDSCLPCNTPNNATERIDLPMVISPNPFSIEALVIFRQPVEGQARLTNATGQLLKTYNVAGTQLIIRKDNLLPGIYFFSVVTADGTSTAKKLIIQ